ncbi:MAG: hypothetical protein LC135_05055 [Phycisphaerae bacterium]|nr:hypothetical protein [Phycisphaerae bacterium]MCZ2399221.1 hypothetical protein [Phycisphaerae bacterium]
MSALMALTANCHRDPKRSRALKPKDFDPFARAAPPLRVGVDIPKDVFIGQKTPGYGGPGGFE